MKNSMKNSLPNSSNPKGLEFHALYEPDMERMVKALRILYEYQPDKPEKTKSNKASKSTTPKVGASGG